MQDPTHSDRPEPYVGAKDDKIVEILREVYTEGVCKIERKVLLSHFGFEGCCDVPIESEVKMWRYIQARWWNVIEDEIGQNENETVPSCGEAKSKANYAFRYAEIRKGYNRFTKEYYFVFYRFREDKENVLDWFEQLEKFTPDETYAGIAPGSAEKQ